MPSPAGIIAEARGFELPDHTPYQARIDVIQKFQGHWRECAQRCLVQAHDSLLECALQLVEKHFARYPKLAKLVA